MLCTALATSVTMASDDSYRVDYYTLHLPESLFLTFIEQLFGHETAHNSLKVRRESLLCKLRKTCEQ